jgi:EthD domain
MASTTDSEAPQYRIGVSGSAEAGYPQCLLKRKPGLSVREFQDGWIEHARLGMPWAMECGMSYYVQIINPRVANSATMPPDVRIEDFDGVAELRIPDDAPGTDAEKARRGEYFERVIVPDECRWFPGPNRDLAVWVPPGTATGTRIEIIKDGEFVRNKDGKPVIDLEQSTKDYEAWKKDYEAGKLGGKS